MILRPYQQNAVEEVRRWLWRGKFRRCLQGPTGCLAAGTPVLLYSGEVTSAESVSVGDVLMGPGGGPRTVLETHSGISDLFTINPEKGDPWTCSSEHVLTLQKTAEKGDDRRAGEIVDVSVRDYLSWSKWRKHVYKQFSVGVEFSLAVALPLDPYFFGVWLGDGSKTRLALVGGRRVIARVRVTKPDVEIEQCCEETAKVFGLRVRREEYKGKCPSYHLVKQQGKVNSLSQLLSELSEDGIDRRYLTASRGDRLALLAGLLDTDGYLRGGYFEIVQKNLGVARDILFLARSLGFRATSRVKLVNGVPYQRLAICGDIGNIPTRIPRKQAGPRRQKKDVSRTGFRVGPAGVGVYYGFKISGDGRHLLGDFTVTHNSGKTAVMAELLRDPLRQVVFSHRRVLLDQISRVLSAAGIRHTFRASGFKFDPTAPIVLAMIQTELKRRERAGPCDADLVHVDEIHCMRGPQYRAIFDAYHAQGASILGYTATPTDLGGMVDDVHQVVSVPELITQGFLCPPRVFSCGQPDVRLLEKLRRDCASGEYLAGDVNKLIKPQIIFGRVLEHYRRLNPDGRPFILFAHSVAASIWWAQSLSAKGVPVAHIDGNDVWVDGEFHKSDRTKRNECFARVESGELKGLSNRFVLREGLDCPIIGHAILTSPFALRSSFVQACGRVLRPFPGRDYSVIQDHAGSSINHPPLDSDEPWDWRSPPGLAERQRIGAMRGDEIPEPIICPKCMFVRNAGDTCPACGYRYAKHARYVIQSDGTLRLVEGRAYKPRQVRPRPDDARIWERIYWKTVKNGGRTAEQAYTYFALNNHWRWLPRTLPLMPRSEADFFIPLRDVPAHRLIPRST